MADKIEINNIVLEALNKPGTYAVGCWNLFEAKRCFIQLRDMLSHIVNFKFIQPPLTMVLPNGSNIIAITEAEQCSGRTFDGYAIDRVHPGVENVIIMRLKRELKFKSNTIRDRECLFDAFFKHFVVNDEFKVGFGIQGENLYIRMYTIIGNQLYAQEIRVRVVEWIEWKLGHYFKDTCNLMLQEINYRRRELDPRLRGNDKGRES